MTETPSKQDIRVVEDTTQSLRSLRKDKDAQWVAGLRPEDEELEILQLRARARAAMEQQEQQQKEAFLRNGSYGCVSISRWWLRAPIAVGALWLLLMVHRLCFQQESAATVREIEFPPYEYREWTLLRHIISSGEARDGRSKLASLALDAVVPSVVPTIAHGLFALILTFRFAVATDDFLCYCGFGSAALTLFAALSSAAIMMAGCSSARAEEECSTPVVSMWLSSLMRWVLPWVSVFPVASVWDGLEQRRRHSRVWLFWRVVCCTPLVLYAAFVAVSKWVCVRTDTTLCGDPRSFTWDHLMGDGEVRHFGFALEVLRVAEWCGLGCGVLFWWRVVQQMPLGLRRAPQYAALPAPGAKVKDD